MTAKDYIQEHIPTMVGEHHVSSMKLTTLISLLNGYASQSKSEISDLKKQLADMTANRIFDYEKSEVEIYNLKKQLDASQSKWVSVTSDNKPEDEQYVSVMTKDFCESDIVTAKFLSSENEYSEEGYGNITIYVTHWQPLPDKPVEK